MVVVVLRMPLGCVIRPAAAPPTAPFKEVPVAAIGTR